jgi:hypothetical protein
MEKFFAEKETKKRQTLRPKVGPGRAGKKEKGLLGTQNKKEKERGEEKKKKKDGPGLSKQPILPSHDRDGLVMENHLVYEKEGAHILHPDYVPSQGKLPQYDPLDPDHVTLIVPAVHLLDKEGDPTP